MSTQTAIHADLVQEFVLKAHGDFDRVQELVAENPRIVNAAQDWGDGDWETALGAAAHVGRRDIALYLLDHGARMDIFAAAMLGEVEIVRAMLHAFPHMSQELGPHKIPLLDHAEHGGEAAKEVVLLLTESMPSSVAAVSAGVDSGPL